jgi:hypothetical protein
MARPVPMSVPKTAFLPSVDGFAFTNSWPDAPAVTIETPFGAVQVGNAANGLCGGMVFAALDYWVAGRTPPSQQPLPASPLYDFIVRRLIDSWHVPAGVAEYYLWMNLPDADITIDVLGHELVVQRGLSWRTIEYQWPLIRASLDAGVPAAIAVVTVHSSNPADLGKNHQVLAWSYAVTGTEVSVRVYDPNSGQDDGVMIVFDKAAAGVAGAFASNLAIDLPVRGFFLNQYSAATPPG